MRNKGLFEHHDRAIRRMGYIVVSLVLLVVAVIPSLRFSADQITADIEDLCAEECDGIEPLLYGWNDCWCVDEYNYMWHPSEMKKGLECNPDYPIFDFTPEDIVDDPRFPYEHKYDDFHVLPEWMR